MKSAVTDTLIIGYGNSLRSDDAVGLRVARQLSASYPVIEIPQLTPELAEDISMVRRVVFIDSHTGLAPGEIAVSSVEPTLHADTHLQTPGDLLRLARDLYGGQPEAWLIGIGPENTDLGETLSPRVEAAIPRAVDIVVGRFSPPAP